MSGPRSRLVGLVIAALALAAAACGPATELAERPCPSAGTTLTYENFGATFFTGYCVRCHGGPNAYSSRAFVTVESIREQRERVFVNSAADNTYMPPGPDGPTLEEREALAEWLACGAP